MSRLLIILALLPILAALGLRWWFGLRKYHSIGKRQCTADLEKWTNSFGPANTPLAKTADARIFAAHLRNAALLDWNQRDQKAAGTREGTRRFGLAVPPLTALIVTFAVLVGKLPVMAAIALFLLAIAFAATFSYLTLAAESRAIAISSRRLRDTRIFPRRDDEDAVIEAAKALVWIEAAPPVLRLLQR